MKQTVFHDFQARIQQAPDGTYYLNVNGAKSRLPDPRTFPMEEDSWHNGQNAWSSEHDQWAKESIEEARLTVGDPVIVTAPNEFEGKTGEIAEFSDSTNEIVGGQVMQIRDVVVALQLPRVVVETNGPGTFAPVFLRRALKGTGCGVKDEWSSTNKNKRILDAFEPPMSAGILWAHTSVLEGPVWDQMMHFNPDTTNQPDDYLDSAAGAITDTPIRIGKSVRNLTDTPRHDWAPSSGTHDVTFET
jgi:hypothetical protein